MEDRLKRVLTYAKKKVKHPDTPTWNYMTTDGFRVRTSADIRRELEEKMKEIEEYEQFEKDVKELLNDEN